MKNKRHASPTPFRLRPIACCVLLACCDTASANPTGPAVAAGAATFQSAGGTLSIKNAPGTIINWQGFSIGSAEHTRFLQQSASSAVLNRVVGSDMSSILGSLTSNGRVFLVNPHGIVFGAGARIDTAGFIASTLNIADKDFLQGKLKFEGGGNGVLRNEGAIRASGDIMLVGPTIENAGAIVSDHGSVLLAAGRKVTITSPDAQGVRFELQAPSDSALNVGTIDAASSVAMFAGTLRHSGDIRATGANVSEGGKVALVAGKEVTVDKGATVTASGLNGGSVTIQSGDLTMVSGHVDATGSAGQGGTVRILGNRVGLDGGAVIDASGETGGGTILVGGDYQGKNTDVQNAWRTFVGPDAFLKADAVTSGNGGKVIVWADDINRYYGSISARGGAQSGNGGFVEVSGKRYLDYRGTVDGRAPHGQLGTLLLDPNDINIVAADTADEDTDRFNIPVAGGNMAFFSEATAAAVSEITIARLRDALNSLQVTIDTQSGAGAPGDINFNAPLDINGIGGPKTLSLVADRNINFNAGISGAGAADILNLTLQAGRTNPAGVTSIRAGISLGGGLLDSNTAGTRVVTFDSGTATISNVSAFNANILNFSGGAATLNGSTTAATLNMSAGSLLGSGNVTVTSAFSRTAGTINSTGDLSITQAAGALATGGAITARSITLTATDGIAAGALTATNGRITLASSAANADVELFGTLQATNTGLGVGTFAIDVSSGRGLAVHDANIRANTSGGVRLQAGFDLFYDNTSAVNTTNVLSAVGNVTLSSANGRIFRSGSAAANLNFLNVTGGSVTLDAVTGITTPGTITASGPVSLTATAGGIDTRAGALNVATGNVALNASAGVNAGAMTASNGTITLTSTDANADVELNGTLQATNAALPAATAAIDVSSGRSVAIGNADLVANTSGAVRVQAVSDLFYDNSVVVNSTNVLTAAGNVTLSSANGRIFRSGSAAGNLNFLNIAGANVTLSAPADIGNLGRTSATSNVTLNAGTAIGSAGNPFGLGTIGGVANASTTGAAGDIYLNGTSSLPLGALSTAAGSTQIIDVQVTGAASDITVNGAINTNDNISLNSGRDILFAGGASVAANSLSLAGAGTARFNAGTVTIDPALTSTIPISVDGATVNLSELDVTTNLAVTAGVLTLGAGNSTVDALVSVSGGTLTANGPLAANTLNVSGGTLNGTGAVTANTVNWSGTSTIGGSGSLNVSSSLAMSGPGAVHALSGGRTINNSSPATLAGGGTLRGDLGGSTFNNSGTFTIADDSSVTNNGGLIAFVNSGALTKSGGAGTSGFAAALTNSGTVNVNSGTLNLSGSSTHTTGTVNVVADSALQLSGGTHTFDAGSTLTGLGNLAVAGGTTNINGTYGLANAITVSGGTANFAPASGAMAATSLDISGGGIADFSVGLTTPLINLGGNGILRGTGDVTANTLDWTGSGTVSGTGALNVNTTLAMSGAGAVHAMALGRTINNAGAATLTGGELRGDPGGASFNNSGTFTIVDDSSVTNNGSAIAFVNTGTLTKSGGAGTSIFAAALTNAAAGRVNANAGTLSVFGFTNQSGTIEIASGATLATVGNDLTNTGTIGGLGTVNLVRGTVEGTLTNNGTLRPGAAGGTTGTLSITGNLTQGAAGQIDIQLAGTGAGSFDVVAVSGAANLGGTLNVAHLDGFNPASDSSYAVMTYASRTGDFATKNFPDGYGTFYAATPNANNYRLALGAVINEWQGVSGSTDFLWQTPGNWTLGHAPTSGEDALIGNVGAAGVTDTITVSSGPQNARKVTSFENLTVSGGALTLGPLASAVNAQLLVSGGQLTTNGPLTADTITLSGGVLDAANGSLPRLDMTGGLLMRSTAGDLTITGPFNLSGGAIAASTGVGNLTTTGSTVITNSASTSRNWFNTGTLDLNGEIVLSNATFGNAVGGRLNVNQAGSMDLAGTQLLNAGRLDLNASNGNQTPFGTQPIGAIVNTGVVNKNQPGFLNLVHPFTNEAGGTVNVNEGTLSAAFGGSQSGAIEIASGATLNTDGSLTNAPGGVIGGRGTLELFGGTLTNDGTLRPGSAGLVASTGTLTVNGDVTNAGSVNVRLGGQADGQFDQLVVTGTANLGGTLNLSTTGGYTATDGDTFTILGAGTVAGDFASMTKTFANGVNVLNRPSFYLVGLGAPTVNSWISNTDGAWNDAIRWSLGHAPLANEQVFINRPANLSVTVPAGNFGADSLRSTENIFLGGTLGLANASSIGAVLSITPGGVLQGAGAVTVAGLSLNGTIASTGGVTVTGIAGPVGNSQITGRLSVNDFRMINGGSLDVAAGGTLNFFGDADKTIGDGTANMPALTNAGLITLAGSNLVLNGATVNIIGNGRFEIQDNSGIQSVAGPLSTVTNAGTLAKTGGAGTSTIGLGPNPLAFVNSGIVDAQRGTLAYAATNTFSNGTTFTGAGSNLVTGNSTFNGTSTSANLTLQSGDFGGNGSLAGTTNWTGGRIVGTVTVPDAATLTLAGAGTKTVDGAGASLTNNGTLTSSGNGGLTLVNGAVMSNNRTATWNGGTGSISIGAGSTLSNAGTFNLNASVADTGVIGAGTFQNSATLNSTAAGVNTLISTAFNNAGTVNVDGGTLRLTANGTDVGAYAVDAGTTLDFGGGTRNLNAGSSVTGAGTVAMTAGTVNVNGGYTTGTTSVSGASANFNGAAVHQTGTLNLLAGTLGGTGNLTVNTGGTWSGGQLSGDAAALTIANGATLNLSGAENKVVSAATLNNAGTINIGGAGNLVLNEGARVNNTGTLDFQSDADVQNTAGGATLTNTGTLLKSGGAGTSVIGMTNPITFNNPAGGTVTVRSGTVQVNGGFPANGGTLDVAAGTIFSTGGAALTNAGTIRGAGTLNLGGATLTNNGTIAPGALTGDPTGTLSITGNLTQGGPGAGRIDVDLGGTAQGEFDVVAVTGTAALAGTLGLSTVGGYAPKSGDIFNILTAATRTGTFDVTTKTFGNEVIPTYSATNLSLLLGSTTGNTWIFDVNDSWASAQRWSQGRVPVATDQVVIDRPAGVFTITVPVGTFSADRITSQENLTVQGTLGLASPSTINGTLAITGGTLQGAAPVTVNGALSLAAGTVSSLGGVTVNGNTNVSGGASVLTSRIVTSGLAMTSGSLGISAAGVLDLVGGASKTISGGATLTNAGTVNLIAGGINLANGGRLTNAAGGTINDTTSSTEPVTGALGGFSNAGTFNKGAAAAETQLISAPFSNTGTVNIAAGTLMLNQDGSDAGEYAIAAGASLDLTGGTRNFNPGLTLGGAGTLHLSGGVLNLNAVLPAQARTWQISGGTLNAATALTLNGPFNWSAGTIAGPARLTTGVSSTTSITGPVTLSSGAIWDNFGVANLTGSASIAMAGAGATTLVNRGVGVINDSASSGTLISGAAGTGFINAGTFNKNIDSAQTQTISAPMTNTGDIEVKAGTLVASAFPVNSGIVDVAAGTMFSTGGAALTNSSAGLLRGTGTFEAGTLINNGVVAPANSPGTLTIAGNFEQGPDGRLEIDVGGTRQGVDYDLLRITGNAKLDGTLAIMPTAATIPSDSDFDIMTYASRTGDFARVTAPPGSTFRSAPGPTGYGVIAVGAVAPPAATFEEAKTVTSKDALVFGDRFTDPATTQNNAASNQSAELERREPLPECR